MLNSRKEKTMKKENFIFKAIVSIDDRNDDFDNLFKKYKLHIRCYEVDDTSNILYEHLKVY